MPSFLCLQHERLSAMSEPAVMADKRPCINECQGYPGYPDGRTAGRTTIFQSALEAVVQS